MRFWLAALLVAAGCHSQPEGIAVLDAPSPPAAVSPSPVQEKMVSLVLLTAEAPAWKPDEIDRAVVRGIPTAARLEDFPSEPPGFTRGFDAEGTLLAVNVVPRPYFEDEAALQTVQDPRIRQLLEAHRGWVSVDVLQAAGGLTDEEKYQRIGRVAAELAGSGTTLLLQPESGQAQAWDPAMASVLRGPKPLDAFAPPGESALEAAMAEARERWPEFRKAFAERKPGEEFSVRAGFTEGDRVEHMWVDVEDVQEESVRGRLGTRPAGLQKIRLGDPVQVSLNQVEDWAILAPDGTVRGGFTVKVLQGATSPPSPARP